jgi:hypothetical protein
MRPPLQPRELAAGRYVFGMGFPAPGQRVPPGQAPPRTSVPILRLSLETSALDTVIQFTPPQQNRPPQVSQATRAVTLSYDVTPLMPGDAWFVYADGTVGVVRGSNYRMDLIGLDGTRTRIDPIPYPKVSVSEADKKRLMESFKREQQERMGQSPQRPPSVDYKDGLPWPAQHPPFNAKGGVLVDPQDRIWLEVRCASTEKATCYDVISRKGERVSRYRLPEHSEIIAVGQGFVYTVNSEKRDKLVVQRHPVK